jgi:hypothetical protein
MNEILNREKNARIDDALEVFGVLVLSRIIENLQKGLVVVLFAFFPEM